MAVVSSVPAPEWSFSHPFDVSTYSLELASRPSAIQTKRRSCDLEWDLDDQSSHVYMKTKKAKTNSDCPNVLQESELVMSSSSPASQPQIEQVLSIIVDAFSNSCKSPPSPPSISTSISNESLKSNNVSIATSRNHSKSQQQTKPSSPLANCIDRAPFVRKVVGGSCAGKTEPKLCRWVLSRTHFLNVRCLDPPSQSEEWNENLVTLRWHYAHPYYQAKAAAGQAISLSGAHGFSYWLNNEFDYDAEDYIDGDWSDEEVEEGELPEGEDAYPQTGVWDSGIQLQLPTQAH